MQCFCPTHIISLSYAIQRSVQQWHRVAHEYRSIQKRFYFARLTLFGDIYKRVFFSYGGYWIHSTFICATLFSTFSVVLFVWCSCYSLVAITGRIIKWNKKKRTKKRKRRNNSLIVLIVDVFYWLHRRDFANLFLFVWVCACKIYSYYTIYGIIYILYVWFPSFTRIFVHLIQTYRMRMV